MKTYDENDLANDFAADDVRAALHDLTADLATPTSELVEAGTALGVTKKRRRTLVQWGAPLAAAAVMAPLAFVAFGGISLPSVGGDRVDTAGPQITVLDPGTPATEAPSGTEGSGGTGTAGSAGSAFPEPVPTQGSGGFGVGFDEGHAVLLQLARHVTGTDLTGESFQTRRGVEGMPADLAQKVNSGHDPGKSQQWGLILNDGKGASTLVASVNAPDPNWSWEAWAAEEGPCAAACTETAAGRLEVETITEDDLVEHHVYFTSTTGWQVLAGSTNADNLSSFGGQVTRPAPPLSVEQITQLVQWDGWLS